MRLRLETRPVAELVPYERNVKLHGEKDVAMIESSIRRFGFNDPIGILPDGTIVEGEGRWLAAQRLELEIVPVLVLEGMSERQAGLYRIAHNKIALTTGFNIDALVVDLRAVLNEDITLEAMGFSEVNIISLLGIEEASALGVNALQRRAAREDEEDLPDYILIWDSLEQKAEFDGFLKAVKQDETPAAALLRYMSEVLGSDQVSRIRRRVRG